MATSGSTNYSVSRDNIIEDALSLLGALGEGESPTTAELTKCSRFFNAMIKAWQAKGLNLWTLTDGVVFIQADKIKYSLNDTTGDWAAKNFVNETRLNGVHASGSTTLTVNSTTGMVAGSAIVIELDNGSITVTDVSSINSSTSLTLTSALTGDCSDNNRVTVYETSMDRPLAIQSIRYKDENDIERPLTQLSRDEYFNLPNKSQSGRPTAFYYDPQLNTGYLYLWYTPNTSSGLLKVSYTRVIEDFDSASDTPDFPIEWAEALTYNLALRLAPVYGKGDDAVQTIGPMAQAFFDDLLDNDNEMNSVSILPDSEY